MEMIQVCKRSGIREDSDINKIHKVIEWAINGSSASLSEIEIGARLHIYDGITTKEIHDIIVRSAVDLISPEEPVYQYVASKLLLAGLRKQVWASQDPPNLYEFICDNTDRGLYDPELVTTYTIDELNELNNYIQHQRDYKFAYAGLRQMVDKYLLGDRSTGTLYETPQFAFMLIAMTLARNHNYDRSATIDCAKRYYDMISTFKVNLPTPILSGARTTLLQYSSCVLVDVDDSIDGISASQSVIMRYVADRAGIGINFGRIRAAGSVVGKDKQRQVISTGIVPFLKIFESTVKSTSQNGTRIGSATVNFPFWHPEIESIIVLKNNTGNDESRVRKLDYVIQLSKIFYERAKRSEELTLFSPHLVPDLYEAFGTEAFDELYEKYENDPTIPSKKIKARSLLELLLKERLETGRIYIMNIDHCNSHSSFIDRVTMTNLCVEITHPTTPLKSLDDTEAEVGVCILSAINLGEVEKCELPGICDNVIRILDDVIDNQEYKVKAAENFTKNRRSLGVGITNLAYYIAKNGFKYGSEALPIVDEIAEAIQYNLLKASCQLAMEKGPCKKFNRTKYSRGILPIDTYCKNVDELVKREYSYDWEELRSNITKYGLRNSTLTAVMPVESSSVVQNSTNGVEPPRDLMTVKKSKSGAVRQLVPEIERLADKYTLAYSMDSNDDYISVIAVIQKWFDMAISANLYYDYGKFDDHRIPLSVLARDIIKAYRFGVKTLYYSNTNDGNDDAMANCRGACKL